MRCFMLWFICESPSNSISDFYIHNTSRIVDSSTTVICELANHSVFVYVLSTLHLHSPRDVNSYKYCNPEDATFEQFLSPYEIIQTIVKPRPLLNPHLKLHFSDVKQNPTIESPLQPT